MTSQPVSAEDFRVQILRLMAAGKTGCPGHAFADSFSEPYRTILREIADGVVSSPQLKREDAVRDYLETQGFTYLGLNNG